jgi:hypothetical protein
LSLAGFAAGLFAFFLGIDGVEHVVIETATTIVVVFAEIERGGDCISQQD